MAILIACDHAGFELKNKVLENLKALDIIDLSPIFDPEDDYPLIAQKLAEQIQNNDFGIAICGTGQGICMALNRFKSIRATLVSDPQTAQIVRQHNHANIICLSGKDMLRDLNFTINTIKTFLTTLPDQSPRHLRRVNELDQIS